MSLAALLQQWRDRPEIVAWETLPARQASTVPFPSDLHPSLSNSLQAAGIQELYRHQAEAWRLLQQGKHIVLTTGTASGKSLAYTLPILDTLLTNPEATALYLAPTKALGRDQQAHISPLLPHKQSSIIAAYDGDTPAAHRAQARKKARWLFTNPDMLHLGILPRHTAWERFFAHLRFVVLDEMHIYRGVFGSHVANVLRRLQRITRFYGSQPLFALTSATIGNPEELASRLIEAPITCIAEDASERGEQTFIVYNPPLLDPELGLRAGILSTAERLSDELLAHNLQTLVFARSRRSAEMLLRRLRKRHPGRETVLRAYRSGYLPEKRREIEKALRQGSARLVSATNALELGVDIGGMDAVVMAGYPGSVASTWQQAGRAGRGLSPSVAVLITAATPFEQYLARHPEYLLQRTPEHALINPDNPLILYHHIRCAAYELPFQHEEGFGSLPPAEVKAYLEVLEAEGALRSGYWVAAEKPAANTSLRNSGSKRVLLTDATTNTLIGEVEEAAACSLVHPGAIYLHEGESYRVLDLDLEEGRAFLRPEQSNNLTYPRRETTLELLKLHQQEALNGVRRHHGEVRVSSRVIGYELVDGENGVRLDFIPLELPAQQLVTHGFWLSMDEAVIDALRQDGHWRSDPNRYGKDWGRIREQILQRDGHRCRLCGITEEAATLHVHHIQPFRLFDDAQQANRAENLITVCPSCHHRLERAVRVRSSLGGLAYLLGQLAPSLLMCSPGDIATTADARSPLAQGSPTVIIYEQIPGGIGFSQHLYQQAGRLLQQARQAVEACPCADGCPACVGAGGEFGAGAKAETLALLEQIK